MLLVQIGDAHYMEIVCGEISVADLQAFAKIVSQLLVSLGHSDSYASSISVCSAHVGNRLRVS